jgi:hypothetical protein
VFLEVAENLFLSSRELTLAAAPYCVVMKLGIVLFIFLMMDELLS